VCGATGFLSEYVLHAHLKAKHPGYNGPATAPVPPAGSNGAIPATAPAAAPAPAAVAPALVADSVPVAQTAPPAAPLGGPGSPPSPNAPAVETTEAESTRVVPELAADDDDPAAASREDDASSRASSTATSTGDAPTLDRRVIGVLLTTLAEGGDASMPLDAAFAAIRAATGRDCPATPEAFRSAVQRDGNVLCFAYSVDELTAIANKASVSPAVVSQRLGGRRLALPGRDHTAADTASLASANGQQPADAAAEGTA